MKKQMLLALWLPLITITFFTSCKKSSSLPTGPYQIRAYDNNYQFGGMVNGKEFTAQGVSGWFGVQPISTTYWNPTINEKDFHCSISYYYGNYPWDYMNKIDFNIQNFTGTGIYKFNQLTNPYGYGARPLSYGGFFIDTSNISRGHSQYFLTNNFGDSGYVECKRWVNETDFEFYFNYTCRNSTVGDPDRSTKTIEGTVIKKP